MRHILTTLLMSLLFTLAPRLAMAACSVELNSASSSQLQTLPGIGPAKAAAILDYRSTAGPFTTVDQLTAVTGIGDATLANVRALICVGEEGAEAASDASSDPQAAADATPTVVAATADAVDINTASEAQLDALPGIGPAKAAAIVADRSDRGPFSSCDDLTRVTGIGPATVAKLAASCTASQAN